MRKVVAALLIGVVTLVAAPAHADNLGRWNKPVVEVYAGPRIGNTWKLDELINSWNLGPVQLVRVYTPCEHCITIERRNIVESYDADGLAWNWVDSNGTLDKCVIFVERDVNNLFKPRLLSHELGHCLGLPHNMLKYSVMSYNPNADVTYYWPSQHDYDNLAAVYTY